MINTLTSDASEKCKYTCIRTVRTHANWAAIAVNDTAHIGRQRPLAYNTYSVYQHSFNSFTCTRTIHSVAFHFSSSSSSSFVFVVRSFFVFTSGICLILILQRYDNGHRYDVIHATYTLYSTTDNTYELIRVVDDNAKHARSTSNTRARRRRADRGSATDCMQTVTIFLC